MPLPRVTRRSQWDASAGHFILTSSLGMPVAAAAHAYLMSVEGTATGHIIDPRKFVAK